MKKLFLIVIAAVACVATHELLAVSAPGTALPPPSTGGFSLLDSMVAKLTTHRRVLVVAAHPDDEDTALLTLVARGMGGESAYLSLSRGDGGQNLIGEELGTGLGVIRTQELNAARKLDGARQYFTRAYDFGYSKSVEEAFRFWPREEIVRDAVRVIRRFRPQIIWAVFSGTPRDGHGQHQESALVARDAFAAAGDPAAFPDLAGEGLTPWQAAAFYRGTRFLDREATTVILPTGGIEPFTGRSYQQIAIASRSLQRSQSTGAIQPLGGGDTRAAWVAGAGGPQEKDLFAAVDTSLPAIAAGIADGAARRRVEERLRIVQKVAEEIRRQLTPGNLAAAVSPLSAALEELRAARSVAASAEPKDKPSATLMLLDEKIAAAQSALAAAAGVAMDALADHEAAVPGESLQISASVWNAGAQPVQVSSVELLSPDAWRVPGAETAARELPPGKLEEWKFTAGPPPGASPTVPYFLRRPLKGALYDWTDAAPSVRGEPFQPPALIAAATVSVGSTKIRIEREVTYRIRDEAFGEIRHCVRAVPSVEVFVEPGLIVWPMGKRDAPRLAARLVSNSPEPVKGRLEVGVPPGWAPVTPPAFALEKRNASQTIEVALRPPATLSPFRGSIPITAVLDGGERSDLSIRLVDYEHIRPTPLPLSSAVELSVVDLRLPPLRHVGYIRGASDREPEALLAVGIPVETLSPRQLEHGDLSRYDAIVVGPRAYETDASIVAGNGRLLDYARGGGLLIVQYQQGGFAAASFAPEKLEITRPFERVTDETAPVRLLDPSHPVFTTPNRIGEKDWDGWVQERGLYFANTWAPSYKPLLAMADPGEPERQGSLLVAAVGKGHYVYTGLAFFRQLPAGVPGAYRLFANLLGWKAGG
jgi:LmbE family N-acetylglucosaminyl deacetylase